MAKKKIETGLFTDQRGRITCREHAPIEGTDTWTMDKWKPMRAAEAARFEKEIGRAPACETCAAETSCVEVQPHADAAGGPPTATQTAAAEAMSPDAPTPNAKPRKPKKAKAKATSDATLEQACEGYLRHLEESGKSQGTLFSYKLELVVAMEELGAKTPLSEITVDHVVRFFGSDRVMRTKTGVEKAPPTYLKTRRVLRQALVWAAEAGMVAKAPLPEDAATY